MVQLKEAGFNLNLWFFQFQFLMVQLKDAKPEGLAFLQKRFQFLMVQLKDGREVYYPVAKQNFNSLWFN